MILNMLMFHFYAFTELNSNTSSQQCEVDHFFMDSTNSPFTQAVALNVTIQPDRWKQPQGPLPQLGPLDLCIVRVLNKRLLSLSEKFDVKSYSFPFVGVDVYPENLSVFSNDLVKQLGVANKNKAECIFYVRDAFVCTDLKVEISFPGSTKLCVCDEEGEPRDVRTEDLDRCYVSSVLRYMNALKHNLGKGVMTDPFEDDFDKFQHFMSSLCRITRDYDIDVKKPISFEEINMNFKMPLRVLAKYVQLRKIYSWIKKYFLDHQIDANSCLKKSPHLVRFYLEVFVSADQHKLVASLLFDENISQVLAQPVVSFYLSKITKFRDEQLSLLKSISYTNKTEVWMGMAASYLGNRYSNFGLLSKALLILDFLAQKKDQSKGKENPLQYYHKPLPFKKRIQFLPEVLGYPQIYRSLLDRNFKLLKETQAADSNLISMKTLLDKFFLMSPIKRQIVTRLSKILKALGRDRFSILYAQTFQSHKIQIDSIECIAMEAQPLPQQKQVPIDLQSEQQFFPSFIAADLKDKILHVNKNDQQEISESPMSSGHQNMDDLAQIQQQMLTSEREYKRNLEEIEMMNSLGKTGKVRRVVSTEFKELVELAIDIRYTLDEIINKLGVDPSKIQTLKTLGLSLDNAMIMAEATMLTGHLIFAVFMLMSIKKRIVDLYSYFKLLAIMLELKDYQGLVMQIGDLMTDLRSLGIADVYYLPCWVEQKLFSAIDKKGRIYIETIAKSNGINDEAMKNSITRYVELRIGK